MERGQNPPVMRSRKDDCQDSGGVHEVVVQQSAEGGLAPDLAGRRGSIRIVVVQRDAVSDALMRAVPVVMPLDPLQEKLQVELPDTPRDAFQCRQVRSARHVRLCLTYRHSATPYYLLCLIGGSSG